jgi:putative redox protein
MTMACGNLPAFFTQGTSMKATVKWVDGAQFLGESGSGHSVVMDGAAEQGGRNMGIRPMEMLLIGMGGCSAFDVMAMLRKSRQQVVDCEAQLEAERADAVPAVFTHIRLHFVVTGVQLKESHVARAVSLSAEKYCSASIMLAAGGVDISHSYEVREFEVSD